MIKYMSFLNYLLTELTANMNFLHKKYSDRKYGVLSAVSLSHSQHLLAADSSACCLFQGTFICSERPTSGPFDNSVVDFDSFCKR